VETLQHRQTALIGGITTTCTVGIQSVHSTARSGRDEAIISIALVQPPRQASSFAPFGDEAIGQWAPFGDAMLDYLLNTRDCRGRGLCLTGWFDIHATLDTPTLAENQHYPQRRLQPHQQTPTLTSKVWSSLGRLKRRIRYKIPQTQPSTDRGGSSTHHKFSTEILLI